jgi:hypothetical protein
MTLSPGPLLNRLPNFHGAISLLNQLPYFDDAIFKYPC